MATGLEITDPHLSAGGGLEEMALGGVKRATQGLSTAAYSESERDQYNARVSAQNQQGNAKLGSLAGSIAGSYFGPIGTALGGMVGGMIGGAIN
jgi:hypothetical protein